MDEKIIKYYDGTKAKIGDKVSFEHETCTGEIEDIINSGKKLKH